MQKFIGVGGISHTRLVGFDRDTDKCCSFDPENVKGYRPPQDEFEVAIAQEKAKHYYDRCLPFIRLEKFSLFEVEETRATEIAETLAISSLEFE